MPMFIPKRVVYFLTLSPTMSAVFNQSLPAFIGHNLDKIRGKFFQRIFLLEKDDLALTLQHVKEFVREQTK